MAVKIEKDTIIGDVLDLAPETAPLFQAAAASPWRKPAWSTAWIPMPSSHR